MRSFSALLLFWALEVDVLGRGLCQEGWVQCEPCVWATVCGWCGMRLYVAVGSSGMSSCYGGVFFLVLAARSVEEYCGGVGF